MGRWVRWLAESSGGFVGCSGGRLQDVWYLAVCKDRDERNNNYWTR